MQNRLETAGIRFIPVSGLGRDIAWLKELEALFGILTAIRKEKPDVLHLNSPKMSGLGAFAGRLLGVPRIIVTVHGWSFAEDRHPAAKVLLGFFSWLTALLAHKVIVISQLDYRAAQSFPLISRKKFVMIPNGIGAIERILPRPEARLLLTGTIRALTGQEELSLKDPLWIGTVTELTHNKDLATLVRAFGALPGNHPLIIIGAGEEKESLVQLIRSLNLQHRVFLTGFLPDAARVLSAFDIFAMTSLKEGLPYALLEAGQARCMVVATETGGIPDIIEHNRTGLLAPPHALPAIAAALRESVVDPELRARLGALLQEKIKRDFSEQNMLENTIKLYL